MSPYEAESSRLYLQTLNVEEHLEDFHSLMSNEKSMMWSMKKPATNLAESLQMMHEHTPTLEKPWNQRWGILLRSENENVKPKLIGIVGVVREPEIGYRIHPDYWGQGYMSEALTMFLEMWWSLEVSQKYDQLRAAADPENLASTRVLLKHGFLKGAYKKDFYARAYLGGEVKSDMQCFYLDRPVEVVKA